ncbi:hypothetical protein NHQ30_008086 [Ciborinia camelliae]|nr:hypothetical protein NHQ30_008086 [Ciborinia camelliae]
MVHSQALFKETEDLLEKWKHPDPYRPPTAPGGSKYERNLPAPILDRKLYNLSNTEIAALTFDSSSKDDFISFWVSHGDGWPHDEITIGGRKGIVHSTRKFDDVSNAPQIPLLENRNVPGLNELLRKLMRNE